MDIKEISGKYFKIVENLLTNNECKELITLLDNKLETIDRGMAIYDRSIMKSQEWANKIYQRVYSLIPKDLQKDFGINNHFRFAKYHKNGHFDLHQDGFNQDESGRRTIYTINIFLNSSLKVEKQISYMMIKLLQLLEQYLKLEEELFLIEIYGIEVII